MGSFSSEFGVFFMVKSGPKEKYNMDTSSKNKKKYVKKFVRKIIIC